MDVSIPKKKGGLAQGTMREKKCPSKTLKLHFRLGRRGHHTGRRAEKAREWGGAGR